MISRTTTGRVRDAVIVMEITKVDTVIGTASALFPAASGLDLLLQREERHGMTAHEEIKIGLSSKALPRKKLLPRKMK
ncbi:hypothetical protein MRX96_035048 [Rhipicephalus microplus]